MEIWKDIEGFEGLYQVSNYGRVKGLKTNTILKPNEHTGYLRVQLSKNGKQTNHFIHRLVARTFIPNPENKPEVNHKDADKKNNHVENLEWVTSKENSRHAVQQGLIKNGSELKNSKLVESDIPKIREMIKQGHTYSQIGKRFGISKTTVWQIKEGVTWTHV